MPLPRHNNRNLNRFFFDKIIESRFNHDKLRNVLENEVKKKKYKQKFTGGSFRSSGKQKEYKYLKGVHNGVYYRIKIPTVEPRRLAVVPNIPKLHTPTSPPMRFTPVGEKATTTATTTTTTTTTTASTTTGSKSKEAILSVATGGGAGSSNKESRRKEFFDYFVLWLKENYSTLILNFGSICTLIGFTRSDVLELRSLAVTGSSCAVMYHITSPPVRIPPILWSMTFAIVNSYKIYQILEERKGSVNLSSEQEEQYTNFFMLHGITPKQYELIYNKANILHVKKGTIIIKKGEQLQHVYLVVNGSTRASILGRFLTAASTTPTAHEERVGGASGAWIGEMALLERAWIKEQQKIKINNANTNTNTGKKTYNKETTQDKKDATTTTPATETIDTSTTADSTTTTANTKRKLSSTTTQQKQTATKSMYSMYTIVADDDCTVLRWSHDDMESLMERSTDMRAALTRAMTAAIVGKVINFTVSRSKNASTNNWTTWLHDWRGAEVQIEEEQQKQQKTAKEEEEEEERVALQKEQDSKENLPRYPIKRFR